MTVAFDSFTESKCGAFVQSRLDARTGLGRILWWAPDARSLGGWTSAPTQAYFGSGFDLEFDDHSTWTGNLADYPLVILQFAQPSYFGPVTLPTSASDLVSFGGRLFVAQQQFFGAQSGMAGSEVVDQLIAAGAFASVAPQQISGAGVSAVNPARPLCAGLADGLPYSGGIPPRTTAGESLLLNDVPSKWIADTVILRDGKRTSYVYSSTAFWVGYFGQPSTVLSDIAQFIHNLFEVPI